MGKQETVSEQYLKQVISAFKNAADPEAASAMEKYMRNKFKFYGITSPTRKELSKSFFSKSTLPPFEEIPAIVKHLWNLPQRELHYFAMELMAKYKKQFEPDTIELIEFMTLNNSWWDTVDYIAAHLAGAYFQKFPDKTNSITGKWNHSDNFWLQRMSLLFQLKYKDKTNTELLSKYIRHLAREKEFFIRKAIGWMLREYSKTNPKFVKKFIDENELSALSKKEGLKRIRQ